MIEFTTIMLNFASAVGLWLVITCGVCYAALSYDNKLTGNPTVSSLIFFNNLNIFIALCEICLGVHIEHIQKEYQKLRLKYKGKEVSGCLAFLTKPLTFPQLFDGKTWALMWSTYALYDPSYQNNESFGFFIDFGNGMSTILPCLIINAGLVFPDKLSHLLVGCISIALYWQVMYGTFIYCLSYCFNKRYKGFSFTEVFLFVVCTNGVWVVFPTIGIYASYCMLRDGNMDIFKAW